MKIRYQAFDAAQGLIILESEPQVRTICRAASLQGPNEYRRIKYPYLQYTITYILVSILADSL